MEPLEEVFFSFTFGGEVSAMAAAMVTLDVMEREDYWLHVWRLGGQLQDAYRALASDFGLADVTDCLGLPPWTVIGFSDTDRWTGLELKTLYQQEMLRRGILFSGSQFVSLAHNDEDIDRTIDAYRDSFRILRYALDSNAVDAMTQGPPNEPVMRPAR